MRRDISKSARRARGTMWEKVGSKGIWTSTSLLLAVSLLAPGCKCSDAQKPASKPAAEVTVLRLEGPSAEQAGATRCDANGSACVPLAPQAKVPLGGLVRTPAGGRISLALGGVGRLDLGGQSELALRKDGEIALGTGDFGVESVRPVESGTPTPAGSSPVKFHVAGKTLSLDTEMPTTVAVRVGSDRQATLTVRQGALHGLDGRTPRAGESVRLVDGQRQDRTDAHGELPRLRIPESREASFGELAKSDASDHERGFGTMTARRPNTTETIDGVRLAKHHVNVVIRDGFARTEVEEEFYNETPQVLEGRYRFPVPGGSSLSRLALWVGDELIEGEVLERERAARVYSSIVDRPVPRDPALLEWVSGGELSLKVFPILPQKSRRVVLAYNEALPLEGGTLRYVYPMSLGEDRSTTIDEFSITVRASDTRAKLRGFRAPFHDVQAGREGEVETVRFSASSFRPNRDFVLTFERDAAPEAQLSAYVPRWGEFTGKDFRGQPVPESDAAGYFALRVTADLPDGLERPKARPTDRAIVVDRSYSQSEGTLRAEAALAFGVLREMDPEESFVLLACDTDCESFPSQGTQAVTAASLAEARRWLTGLRPRGASDISGALITATRRLTSGATEPSSSHRQVIYVGDGQASAGELSAETIAGKTRSTLAAAQIDLRLVAAGRTVDDVVLSGLAEELGAPLHHLTTGESLLARIADLSLEVRQPVVRNLRLELPGTMRTDAQARLRPLRLGEEVVLYGELLGVEAGEVTLHGELDGAPYRLTRPIRWTESASAQNPLVPRLWAEQRIARLQGSEETAENRRAIIDLSRRYRTLSRYTSFLVLESDEMFESFGIERTNQGRPDAGEAEFSKHEVDDIDEEDDTPPQSLSMTSLEAFEESGPAEKKGSTTSASKATARPRRAPTAAKPKARPPSERSAPLADFGSGRGVGGLGSSTEGAENFPDFEPAPSPLLRRPLPRPIRRRIPTFHVTHQTGDDVWRTWGEENLNVLSKRLSEDDDSRQRHEAFIRGLLQHGRFVEARGAAEHFASLDPDHAPARQLLAYASVVSGHPERALDALDSQVESDPRDAVAHIQAARAFEAAGEETRACAHWRSLAEIAPQADDALAEAGRCEARVMGTGGSPHDPTRGKEGLLEARIECDAGVAKNDCPSVLIVAPDGSIVSPWTPTAGRSGRDRVTLVKARSGDYWTMTVGGASTARGKIILSGRGGATKAFRFERGGLQTVARSKVAFY